LGRRDTAAAGEAAWGGWKGHLALSRHKMKVRESFALDVIFFMV